MTTEPSYEEFVQAHNLPPLVDIKTACRVAAVRQTRFYEEVDRGKFVLVPNGRRRFVTAKNLHEYYLALVSAARGCGILILLTVSIAIGHRAEAGPRAQVNDANVRGDKPQPAAFSSRHVDAR